MKNALLICCIWALLYLVNCSEDKSLVMTASIYESPLSINSACKTAYYIRFDEAGNAISKTTYFYNDIGKIISIDIDEILEHFEYDQEGKFNYLIEFEDSIFYAIEYGNDTINEYSVIGPSVGSDSLYLNVIRRYWQFNIWGKPELSIYGGDQIPRLETITNSYDNLGNLTFQLNGFGLAGWISREYHHDPLLKDPFPSPAVFEERSNAITNKVEIFSVPNVETHYDYKSKVDAVEVYIITIKRFNGSTDIVSESEFKLYEIHFECPN